MKLKIKKKANLWLKSKKWEVTDLSLNERAFEAGGDLVKLKRFLQGVC